MLERHKYPHQKLKLGRLICRGPRRLYTETKAALVAEFYFQASEPRERTRTNRFDYVPKGELVIYASGLFSAPIDKKVHRVGLEKEKLALPLS